MVEFSWYEMMKFRIGDNCNRAYHHNWTCWGANSESVRLCWTAPRCNCMQLLLEKAFLTPAEKEQMCSANLICTKSPLNVRKTWNNQHLTNFALGSYSAPWSHLTGSADKGVIGGLPDSVHSQYNDLISSKWNKSFCFAAVPEPLSNLLSPFFFSHALIYFANQMEPADWSLHSSTNFLFTTSVAGFSGLLAGHLAGKTFSVSNAACSWKNLSTP